MKTHPSTEQFTKRHVVMKKGIPVFEGEVATGMLNGTEFAIVCPDAESCEEIWNLIMPNPLDRDGLQRVVLCRQSDIEMDVSAGNYGKPNMSAFDIEAARRGEPVERIYGAGWQAVEFVAQWNDTDAICRVLGSDWPQLVPLECLRMAPKKIKVRYRVALLKYEGCNPYTRTADSEEKAENWESFPPFIRWLTDWQEAEVEQ